MRPLVLACNSIDSLREIADCLQMDVLEPQRRSSDGLVSFLGVVYRLHKDVQEKLIYRVEMYIRDDIKGYVPSSSDMDYPSMLYSCDSEANQDPDPMLGEFRKGWFPSLPRTLSILAKIYRVLEMSTFQGIAQEAVDLCMHTLKEASQVLARRSLPSSSELQAVLPLVQMMDSQLFLVKHLLLLREQVAAFECELVVSEKYFNFGNLWEALNLKLPDGILGILKPTIYQAEVDSKKDIESELKSACEALITNITAHITQPLAAMNMKIGNFLANPQVDRASLKDQRIMMVSTFLDTVKVKVPFATAHIRLYLSTPGGTDASRSTSPILFKPVEMRLVDTWGRLEGLLEEQKFTSDELAEMGFIRPEALRELVSSLFNSVMEAPWESIVQTVAQAPPETARPLDVPRSAPAVRTNGRPSWATVRPEVPRHRSSSKEAPGQPVPTSELPERKELPEAAEVEPQAVEVEESPEISAAIAWLYLFGLAGESGSSEALVDRDVDRAVEIAREGAFQSKCGRCFSLLGFLLAVGFPPLLGAAHLTEDSAGMPRLVFLGDVLSDLSIYAARLPRDIGAPDPAAAAYTIASQQGDAIGLLATSYLSQTGLIHLDTYRAPSPNRASSMISRPPHPRRGDADKNGDPRSAVRARDTDLARSLGHLASEVLQNLQNTSGRSWGALPGPLSGRSTDRSDVAFVELVLADVANARAADLARAATHEMFQQVALSQSHIVRLVLALERRAAQLGDLHGALLLAMLLSDMGHVLGHMDAAHLWDQWSHLRPPHLRTLNEDEVDKEEEVHPCDLHGWWKTATADLLDQNVTTLFAARDARQKWPPFGRKH
eukprot:g16007.t1